MKYFLNKWNSYSAQGQMLLIIIGLCLAHILITLSIYSQ